MTATTHQSARWCRCAPPPRQGPGGPGASSQVGPLFFGLATKELSLPAGALPLFWLRSDLLEVFTHPAIDNMPNKLPSSSAS